MPVREALKKSLRNGLQEAKEHLKQVVAAAILGMVILFLVHRGGILKVSVKDIVSQYLSAGIFGIIVVLTGLGIAFIVGFTDMFRKYRNTGKLGELAIVGMTLGGSLVGLYILDIQLAKPTWVPILGLCLVAAGGIFYENQRQKRDYSS